MSPFPRLPRWHEGEPVPNCIGCQLGRKVPLEKCPPLTDDTATGISAGRYLDSSRDIILEG